MILNLIHNLSNIKRGFMNLYNKYVRIYNLQDFGHHGILSEITGDSSMPVNNVYLDDYTIIQNQTNLISHNGKLIVKKYSVIASGCTIIPSSHTVTVGIPFFLTAKTHINDNETDIVINEDCWIGASCIILPNCNIGRGAIIGAGCIVNRDIPPYSVVVGSPAKIIASKFTKEEIIQHERHLYPLADRMTNEQLDSLFNDYFKGLKSIGTTSIEEKDKQKIAEIIDNLNIKDYYNDK